MNLKWIIDPKHKVESVSLTMLVIAFVLIITGGILQIFKIVESTSILMEVFVTCCALYFGRNFSIAGKNYDSTPAQQVADKLEGK